MYDELIKDLREWPRICVEYTGSLDELHDKAADAIEELSYHLDILQEANTALYGALPKWIPVTERLPECDLGSEVGNIEWISNGMVHAGCFGRGGKYRDAYFRTWPDAGEGMDAKDADYWRAVTLPEPPKEVKTGEGNRSDGVQQT